MSKKDRALELGYKNRREHYSQFPIFLHEDVAVHLLSMDKFDLRLLIKVGELSAKALNYIPKLASEKRRFSVINYHREQMCRDIGGREWQWHDAVRTLEGCNIIRVKKDEITLNDSYFLMRPLFLPKGAKNVRFVKQESKLPVVWEPNLLDINFKNIYKEKKQDDKREIDF
jgi:hypothetical protein